MAGRRGARHVGFSPGFVNEDNPIWIKLTLMVFQCARNRATFGLSCSLAINIFLKRDGIVIDDDKGGRLWAENGFQVPRKRSRRRSASNRSRPFMPSRPNAVWSDDLVCDACANGQQITCLTVVDEYTQESLAIDVVGAIRFARVIEVLSKLISLRGAPRYLRSPYMNILPSLHSQNHCIS